MNGQMRMRTRISRLLYRLAGLLTRIKTPRYTYRVVSYSPEFVTERIEPRRWLPCRLSIKMLGWSMRVDREHWDHWALDHADCTDVVHCSMCGGVDCE